MATCGDSNMNCDIFSYIILMVLLMTNFMNSFIENFANVLETRCVVHNGPAINLISTIDTG